MTDETTTEATEGAEAAAQEAPQEPFLRVVKGNPDAVELAAVIALFAARSGGGESEPVTTVGGWSSKSALLRPAVSHGPGAWAASARQR